MLNQHSKLGIAQTSFYVPVLSLIAYLNFRHGFRRERGWIYLLIFSSMRLAGGIIVIVLAHDPGNVGLIIATTILLGVGVPPLFIATMRFVGTACTAGFEDMPMLHKAINLSRFVFLIALAFLITGGTLSGLSGTASIGQRLLQVAYIILAVFLAGILGFQIYLVRYTANFEKSGKMLFKATVTAVPLLVVRIAYAFLAAFYPSQMEWKPLQGSVGTFIGMVLIPEYVVVVIFIYVGLCTPHSRHEG